MHVPVADLAIWISIPIHLIGGLALLVGFRTRWAAALLTLVCLGTAFGVHLPEGDSENMIHFYKNLVMAGGFIYVMTYGSGRIGIDKPTAQTFATPRTPSPPDETRSRWCRARRPWFAVGSVEPVANSFRSFETRCSRRRTVALLAAVRSTHGVHPSYLKPEIVIEDSLTRNRE